MKLVMTSEITNTFSVSNPYNGYYIYDLAILNT